MSSSFFGGGVFEKRLIIAFCLMLLLGIAGCGSNGGSSSGGTTSSVTGSGSGATAFMKNGTVSLEYLDKTTGNFSIVPFASGSCENSKISLTLPDNYIDYLPMIVSVSGATLMTSAGQKTMASGSRLSRLFSKSSELNSLYLTIFSTVKAEAWKNACLAGATEEQADSAGRSALETLFNSLALSSDLAAENIENVDPTGTVNAGVLEKAQQSARIVLGVGSDEDGLTGLTAAINSKIAEKASNAAVNGVSYTASDFITDFKADNDGNTPAAIINSAVNKAKIDSSIKGTFDNSGEASTVTAMIAKLNADAAKVDYSALVGISVSGGKVLLTAPTSGNVVLPLRQVIFTKADGSETAEGITYNATAEGGILIASGTTESPAPSFKNKKDPNLKITIPNNLNAGVYRIILSRQPGLSCVLPVKIVGQGVVTVSGVKLKLGSPHYLGFSGESKVKVSAFSTAVFSSGQAEEAKPATFATLTAAGAAPSADTSFLLKYTLPDGVVFSDVNNSKQLQGIITYKKDSGWTTSDPNFILNIIASAEAINPCSINLTGAALNVKAATDMTFGKYSLGVSVYDSTGKKLLANDSSDIYLVNTSSADQIAQISDLKYGSSDEKNVGDHIPFLSGYKRCGVELAKPFSGTISTWKSLAGGSVSGVAPAGVALYESPVTCLGGFYDNVGYNRSENLEIPSAKFTVAGTTLTVDPSAESNHWLQITCGSKDGVIASNYELINLKFWYGPDCSSRISSDSSVKFFSKDVTP